MKYIVQTQVKSAEGWQHWHVEANSPEEAIANYKAGKGEFAEEDVEVVSLEEPEVIGTVPIATVRKGSHEKERPRDSANYG